MIKSRTPFLNCLRIVQKDCLECLIVEKERLCLTTTTLLLLNEQRKADIFLNEITKKVLNCETVELRNDSCGKSSLIIVIYQLVLSDNHMFNIFKVAGGLLQTVPNLSHLPDSSPSTRPQQAENMNYMQEDIHQARSPQRQKRAQEQKGKSLGQGKDNRKTGSNKKDNNNDDNNGGGLLEPIIEDLQGYIKGRRMPVLNV